MTSPAVSVVIPTRNRARMLETAVRSALDQTFRDLEVLVVDDASEDETPLAVSQFEDTRLRYIRGNSPVGGAAARNIAIQNARGEYLAFLDDDDEWFPSKLDRQMDVFRTSSVAPGVVYASYLIVDRNSGDILAQRIASKRGDLSRELLTRNYLGGSSCVVTRRELLEKVGLFDESLPSFHDYDLWIRLSPHTQFDFVEEPMLKYYLHGRNIWRNYDALDRGIDGMLRKHGRSRDLRRNLGRQSLWVGVHRCREGEVSKGRRAMLRSARLNPLGIRAYLHLGLSFLGGDRYRRLSDARQRRLSLREELS
jgi:glycosyltransferase involved in cell wall biosynthesis